jgi:hypothetical protein
MMNMMKLFLSLAIMIVLLGGCPIFGDTFDHLAPSPPYLTVSVNEAAVGDFVDVQVEANWALAGSSRLPDDYIYTEIGACFEIRSERKVGGFCKRVLPLPDGLRLAEGDALFTDHGKVVVRRGETVDIEHHFRLTADQPSEVVITGILSRRSIEDDQRGIEIGRQEVIKFK